MTLFKNVALVGLLVSFQAIAQQKPNRVLGLGVTISPELSNSKLDNRTTYFAPAQTSGLLLSYDINDRFGLSTGIWYSTKIYSQKYTVSDNTGNVVEEIKSYNSINYLELPALLNIKAGNSNSMVRFYSSIGPVIGVPVSAHYKTKPDQGNNFSTYVSTMNTIVSAYIGAGASITFSDKWLLLIEPHVSRSFTHLYKSEAYPKSQYFYSYGVRVSMLYTIKLR